MLKAVIFDLDNTLIDWTHFRMDWARMEADHLRTAFEYICTCHPLNDLEAFAAEYQIMMRDAWIDGNKTLVSPHVGRLLVAAAEKVGVPAGLLDMEACIDAYQWRCIPGTLLFPEVIEQLALLRSHGLRFGIVTNAPQTMRMRDHELAELGLSEFFPECRFSAADHGKLKPHPEIFQAALDCLGVTADEAVFVGDDAVADIMGANSVGIFAVHRMIEGYHHPANSKADAEIDSLDELPGIFDRQFPGWR
jgi:FMN phosphatase YigB (HAD superfamily)